MAFFRKITHATILGTLLSSVCAIAQQPLLGLGISNATLADKTAESGKAVVASRTNATAQPTALSKKIDRWLDVTELSFSSRYRSEKASDDYAYIENAQERSIATGRLKLDAAARYTVNFKVSSGQTFNWAYSDTINADFQSRITPSIAVLPYPVLLKLLGLYEQGYALPTVSSTGWQMSPRQLNLSAQPVNGLTAEYGSLGIERGKGSEITTYDDDGYITGERLRLTSPKHAYFDEIAITYAYEGDILSPNFFDRTQHLKKSNYHQFLFVKNFNKRVSASTDYTFDKKTHTIREAAYIKLPETKVLDALRVELYQRLNSVYLGPMLMGSGSGFGITAEKTLFGGFKLDGGYEQVDPYYGVTVDNVIAAAFGFSMNGDAYSTGKHVFAHGTLKIAPFATLSGFYIHQTEAQPSGEFGFAKEGFNGGINIDLKKLVNSKKDVF